MLSNRVRTLLLSGSAAVASIGTAQAQTASQSTAAGTSISNTASVAYTVNGTAQTTNSTTATFVVDRKVNFTVVVDQTTKTQVNLGDTQVYTKFKVTNTTNGTQDFLLDPDQSQIANGLVAGIDDFDMLNVKAYVDSNNNGVYDPGVDTATFIDELAPDASVEVFIVGNVPAAGTISQANVDLHVTAAAGGQTGLQGTALVATDLNLANADNTVDIVFADDDDDGIGVDILRNGQGRAYASFEIGTRNVALTVTKSALVLSDGVNTLNPKALPGATVQYCLLVRNATLSTAANGVILNDTIPANTTYVPGSIVVGLPGGTCALSGAPVSDSTGFNSTTKNVSVTVGTVAGGASTAVAFKVTIN
ncbi:hypothetical protein [Sphingomonas sp. CARO-RG-8B-R24-01]|uniref:hypothetical protein n=1 Tax=Sphingomonas sp. CARO-RG-8B-R24-01 TaxID=2914831 RepID=UPI001F55AF3E|nr:hypothetical protein [Sphingomonas sp. CARO-RG-8B-R24-01]